MIPTRSPISLARKMSWVDIRMALPSFLSSARISRNSSAALGSRPEVGSSSRMAGASLMMAIEMPSFWRMPLEKFLTRCSKAFSWSETRRMTW